MFKPELTDERAIILLNEFAKIDIQAFKLMALLQAAKDFGDRDMLIGQIHHYVYENSKDV